MREDAKTRIQTRTRLWKEQKGLCPYCKKTIKLEQASLDHIIPVDKLEKNYGVHNLIVCCKWCNKNKGNFIVFSNLFDKEIYVVVDIPYIFQYTFITNTKKIRMNT
jgi:uncharacterized protein (TIGR02646 family)